MMDLLFQIALSNVCISLALVIVAITVESTLKRPQLAHLLWLLVFVKLITPPVVTIPVVTIPAQPDSAVVAINEIPQQGPLVTSNRELHIDLQSARPETAQTPSLLSNIAAMSSRARPWLASVWLLGSVFVFAWSLARVYRFNRLLWTQLAVGPQEL